MAPRLLALQPQKAIRLEFSAVYSTGENSEPACELSQKGCVEERPQAHHL